MRQHVIKHLNTIEVSQGRKYSSDGGLCLEQVCIAFCVTSCDTEWESGPSTPDVSTATVVKTKPGCP